MDAVNADQCDNARAILQEQRALALTLWEAGHGFGAINNDDAIAIFNLLQEDPEAAIATVTGHDMPPIVQWRHDHDEDPSGEFCSQRRRCY